TFRKQKEIGWIPADAKLTPRAESMASWEPIPEAERPFQRRLMEIFAGFTEHVDAQAGRILDELERLGVRNDTIVFYVVGDNGASAEGQRGSISELLAQNGIPTTIEQQLAALARRGGLPALGGPKVDNMFHAGWAWGCDAPFRSTKLVAEHFGGIRNPLAIAWPARIRHDATPRPQFHHVNDLAPTIYEIAGIKPPRAVDGVPQDPIDGISMVYTFDDASVPTRKTTQYFENAGGRGLWHEGWFAGAFGPLVPWDTAGSAAAIKVWNPDTEPWELYDLRSDYSQADDLAAKDPDKLA
ncbi:MAG: sulfatase-like hydrolase/transferase, partial [Alphaproteobacteria bacterium]